MNKLPIVLFKEIGKFVPVQEQIYLYFTCKEAYAVYFVPKKQYFKNKFINTYKLCTKCYKRCYKEDTIMTLCRCLGNYNVKHYNCTSDKIFHFSLGVTNCPVCNKKTMEFCKLYRRIA